MSTTGYVVGGLALAAAAGGAWWWFRGRNAGGTAIDGSAGRSAAPAAPLPEQVRRGTPGAELVKKTPKNSATTKAAIIEGASTVAKAKLQAYMLRGKSVTS